MTTTRVCSVAGCDKPHDSHGYCGMHQRRMDRHGDVGEPQPTRLRGQTICAVEGCDKPYLAHGYCAAHYTRWQRHGEPSAGRVTIRRAIIVSDNPDECWGWQGALSPGGYAVFNINGHHVPAHRLAYEEWAGPIPDGLTIDHKYTCPKCCCNPRHLRVATQKQQNENHNGPRRDSTSGIRGVYLDKRSGKWHVRVQHNGRTYYRGGFTNKAVAAQAVIELRKKLHTFNDLDRATL